MWFGMHLVKHASMFCNNANVYGDFQEVSMKAMQSALQKTITINRKPINFDQSICKQM
jgi:hypothetical protein